MNNILKPVIFNLGLLFFALTSFAQSAPLHLSNQIWKIDISEITGAITSISNKQDKIGMNWVHPKFKWGTLIITNKKDTLNFDRPSSIKQISKTAVQAEYRQQGILLNVKRKLTDQNTLDETYTITNKTSSMLSLPIGSVDLTAPFHDSYEGGASVALQVRSNAHIWANGSSSYINGVRMSGVGPHLGLVLSKGSLSGYSLSGATFSNDRGRISLNPEGITLKPGESYTLTWRLFWHTGWDDFWNKALGQSSFVQLKADKYTVLVGETIKLTGKFAPAVKNIKMRLNGKPLPVKITGDTFTVNRKAITVGEQLFEIEHNGGKEILIANVVANPMELIKARVNFIIDKQQRIDPGSPLDGAYLIYDNETATQFRSTSNDKNEARERMGMGVLIAQYLPYCKDKVLREKILTSLNRFKAFIAREIQDSAGIVYNASHYKDNHRIYNSPWVGHFHLAMYQATKDTSYLQLFTKTVTAYYKINKGHNYGAYPIGMQIQDGLNALQKAGMSKAYQQVFDCFYKHASRIAEIGKNYPTSEVAYEQSIVAPGVQICLEMYSVTKEMKFLTSAKEQLVFLEAFNGQQPDYHLNDMAIRHWDDYWFGKLRLYGDTFPHYWQTLTAIAFDEYADATKTESYNERAKQIFMNNLCQFTIDGKASCAYVYPMKSMGSKGQQFDPWANDQDWALVNLLTIYNRGHLKF